jgi:hypothetical protein
MLLAITASLDAQQADAYGLKRLGATPLTIPGAKIDTEEQAQRLAFSVFADARNKASNGVSATESAQIDSVVTLGFDLDGFGRRGDKVWQATIREMTAGLGVTALIWIHAQTGQTRILLSR